MSQLAPFDPSKKKKKKKVVIHDPTDGSVEQLAEKTESLSVSESLEPTFTGLKKKKKKQVEADPLEDDKENNGEDLDHPTGSDEQGEGTVLEEQMLPWEGTDRDYEYEELLGRVFHILRENNPELAGDRRRTVKIWVLKFYHWFIVKADVDGNGVLEYGEFVAVTIHLQKMENDEHLRRAFMFFDKDGSGYIELDELEQVLYEPGQADIAVLNEIVKEVDTDKDGRISFEEFVAMMKSGTDWRKASRQYSRDRFTSLSVNLMKNGALQLEDALTGQTVMV